MPSGRQAKPWPAAVQLVAFCVARSKRNVSTGFGLAYVDVSTGELLVTSVQGPNADEFVAAELVRRGLDPLAIGVTGFFAEAFRIGFLQGANTCTQQFN